MVLVSGLNVSLPRSFLEDVIAFSFWMPENFKMNLSCGIYHVVLKLFVCLFVHLNLSLDSEVLRAGAVFTHFCIFNTNLMPSTETALSKYLQNELKP